MMNLAEYRRTASRLADFLPWVALVGEGVKHAPLTYQALLWALEAASHELLGGAVRPDLEEVKRVLGDLLVDSLCKRTT